MVVHASTILRDALERMAGGEVGSEVILHSMDGENLVVTPVMIDQAVRNVAARLALALDIALQPELTTEEMKRMRI